MFASFRSFGLVTLCNEGKEHLASQSVPRRCGGPYGPSWEGSTLDRLDGPCTHGEAPRTSVFRGVPRCLLENVVRHARSSKGTFVSKKGKNSEKSRGNILGCLRRGVAEVALLHCVRRPLLRAPLTKGLPRGESVRPLARIGAGRATLTPREATMEKLGKCCACGEPTAARTGRWLGLDKDGRAIQAWLCLGCELPLAPATFTEDV